MSRKLDVAAAEQAIAKFLEALGYDLERPDLRGTPSRVVDAYTKDLLCGEDVDLALLVERGSVPSEAQNLVVIRGISVATVCPHHLLPAQGEATVAYLPGDRVLGLGTMSHLVDACSRRLEIQEHIGEHVTSALIEFAGARGAYCSLRLEHACLRIRGARQSGAAVQTVHLKGEFRDPARAAELALALGTSERVGEVKP
ncbi:MAG TPA: GTP cyclohydrolase I [Polyangiaceae bacterium]|nr:GTP cyclohydrolase I [Polyangiaceae bacterium]